jgi:hypothetical protein
LLFAFEIATRLYEHFGRNAKLPRNGQQIRLEGFEEADRGREEAGLAGTAAEFICSDSGQVDEPLGASCVTKHCRKGGKA